MNNLMYKAKTKDGKWIEIFDDGSCNDTLDIEYAENHFQRFVDKKVTEQVKNLIKSYNEAHCSKIEI